LPYSSPAMNDHDRKPSNLKLSDFTEPFRARYSCALSYTEEDGWSGLCTGPRGFQCRVTAATGEECCSVAWQRVSEHHGSEECELFYKYTDDAWARACAEEEQDPKVRAQMLACPLCNAEHPEREQALRRATAHLN
jgi:hypothetical protein